MKLPRPYIPTPVRIKVAQRQLRGFGFTFWPLNNESPRAFLDRMMGRLPWCLGSDYSAPLQLDHDPALCNRKFNKHTGRYTPAANDPRYLVYRTKADHEIKTRVRGDGAQLSDQALLRKQKRITKRILSGKRPKYGVRQWNRSSRI